MDYVLAAKAHFDEIVEKFGDDKYFSLVQHVPLVEKWAMKVAKEYPDADQEVLAIAAWLHDTGHYLGDEEDHAISSEKDAEIFLKKIGYKKTEQVKHCIRAHRNGDVKPESIEAKLLAFSDSASHMSDCIYLDMFRMWGRDICLAKLERDWRDVSSLPEGKKLEPLYIKWKELITEMPEWVFDLEREKKIAIRYVAVP